MITRKAILEYAYKAALHKWGRESDRLSIVPNNPIQKDREAKAYSDLEDISKLLYAEEDTANE